MVSLAGGYVIYMLHIGADWQLAVTAIPMTALCLRSNENLPVFTGARNDYCTGITS